VAARPPPLTPAHAIASVVETRSLSAYFTRIILEVPDVERLGLPDGADTAVGVYFDGGESGPGRTYTVRHDDRRDGRLVLDILLHGDGVGTAWAGNVAPGDEVVLAHANSWYGPPPTTGWQLLVADMAGLPALARILDEPPSVPTTVIVDVADDELAYLPSQHDVTLVPVFGGALLQRVFAYAATEGSGYCWFAGEASVARAVRKHLRRELHWRLDQLDVMGYWRRHSADWETQFALVGAGLYSAYNRALDDGKSVKDAMEEFDDALEQRGL
jgi:NADPH-dependent ferric siderophore reductase